MTPHAPGRPAPSRPTVAAQARETYGRYFDNLRSDALLQSSMADLYSALPPERQFIDTHLLYIATQQLGRLEMLQRAQLQAAQQTVALLQAIAKATAVSATGTGELVDGLELLVDGLTRPPDLPPDALVPDELLTADGSLGQGDNVPDPDLALSALPPDAALPPAAELAPLDDGAPGAATDETSGARFVDAGTGKSVSL